MAHVNDLVASGSFITYPHASFTSNTGERRIRMAKVRPKVSGCFRTRFHAEAWCRIPGYLISMAAQGYNPPSPSRPRRPRAPETPPT